MRLCLCVCLNVAAHANMHTQLLKLASRFICYYHLSPPTHSAWRGQSFWPAPRALPANPKPPTADAIAFQDMENLTVFVAAIYESEWYQCWGGEAGGEDEGGVGQEAAVEAAPCLEPASLVVLELVSVPLSRPSPHLCSASPQSAQNSHSSARAPGAGTRPCVRAW